MKFLDMMSMELRFISAQGRTSILILLYPLVLMLVVGPIFTSMGAKGVLIAVHSDFEDEFPAFDDQSVLFVDSQEQVLTEVLSGNAVLGISLETDETNKRRMFVYYEPHKEIVANALALQLQGKLSDISAELVETNLVSIWGNMRGISDDIDDKLAKMPELKASLRESKLKMQEMSGNIQDQPMVATANMLHEMDSDAVSMQQSLAEARGKLSSWDEAVNQLSSYDSKLQYYDSRLSTAESKLIQLEASLAPWDSKLAARVAQLDAAINALSTYLQMVQSLKASSSGTTYGQLQQIESGIQDSISQISSARNELMQMRNDLASLLVEVSSARNEISLARSDIQATRQQVSLTSSDARNDISIARERLSDASNRLSSASQNLGAASASLESYSSFSGSMQEYLGRSSAEIDSLASEVDGTEHLLRNAKMNIDSFLSNDPHKYVPLKIESNPKQKRLRSIDSVFPMLLGLVSMLSCLLLPPIMAVKQKAQGVRMRIKLSYAGTFSIVLGKFLGDYLVGLLQVVLVALIGSLAFGINLGSDYASIVAAILLAPAVFTAMGTLIASLVSNEGSAVLTSLLLSMPMLFLSGILLPIEQIHGSLRSAAAAMPLYNVVEMISKTTVRDSAMFANSNIEICLGYFLLFLAASYMAWMKKE